MEHIDDGAVVLRWRRHPSAVGLARLELRKALAGWGLSALEDSAALVLSELVTNAVRHARVPPGREIETRFLPTGLPVPDGLRIEVHDGVCPTGLAWGSWCGRCGDPPTGATVMSDLSLRALWALLRGRAARSGGSCPWGCRTPGGDLSVPRLAERFIAYEREATDTPSR